MDSPDQCGLCFINKIGGRKSQEDICYTVYSQDYIVSVEEVMTWLFEKQGVKVTFCLCAVDCVECGGVCTL